MRLLGWAWLIVLTVVALSTSSPGRDTTIVVATMVLATLGAGLTLLAARQGFLGSVWYAALDGLIVLVLATAGLITDFGEFLVGGYPASWLFIVAFATTLTWTAIAAPWTTRTTWSAR
jgi:hypothetical protein